MPTFPAGAHVKGGQNAAPVHAAAADAFYRDVLPLMISLRSQGLSLRAIADELTQRGIKARKKQWSAAQVLRVLRRAQTPPIASQVEQEPPPAPPAAPSPPSPPGGGTGGEDSTASGSPPAARQVTLWLKHGMDGPHPIEQVERMLADGTATGKTLAREGNGPWRPLGSLIGDAVSD
jgi:hypothetical protein